MELVVVGGGPIKREETSGNTDADENRRRHVLELVLERGHETAPDIPVLLSQNGRERTRERERERVKTQQTPANLTLTFLT